MLGRIEDEQLPISDRLVTTDVEPSERNIRGIIWTDEFADSAERFFAKMEGRLSWRERWRAKSRAVEKGVAPLVTLQKDSQRMSVAGPLILDLDHPLLTLEGAKFSGDTQLGNGLVVMTRYAPNYPGRIHKLQEEKLFRVDIGVHRDRATEHQVWGLVDSNQEVKKLLNTSFLYYSGGVGKIVSLPPGVEDNRPPIAFGQAGERFVWGCTTYEDSSLFDLVGFNLMLKVYLPPMPLNIR